MPELCGIGGRKMWQSTLVTVIPAPAGIQLKPNNVVKNGNYAVAKCDRLRHLGRIRSTPVNKKAQKPGSRAFQLQ